MHKYLWAWVTLACLGCGGSAQLDHGSTAASKERDNEAVTSWKGSCAALPDTPVRVSYQDTSGGAAVLFATDGDPEPLRERVEEVARHHDQPTARDLYDLPHTATVQDTEDGAKLTLTASAFNDMDALRRHVQKDVWAMQRSDCVVRGDRL